MNFENFEQLSITNRKRCEAVFHPVDEYSPADWGLCLVGEVGEVANEIKKLKRGDSDLHNVAAELADVLIYADLAATRLGLTLWYLRQNAKTADVEEFIGEIKKSKDSIRCAAIYLSLLSVGFAGMCEEFDGDGSSASARDDAKEHLGNLVHTVEFLGKHLVIELWPAVVRKFNEVSDRKNSDIKIPLPE